MGRRRCAARWGSPGEGSTGEAVPLRGPAAVAMARLMSDPLSGLPGLKHRFETVRMHLANEWDPMFAEAMEILARIGREYRAPALHFRANSALWPELAALYGVRNAPAHGSFGVYLVSGDAVHAASDDAFARVRQRGTGQHGRPHRARYAPRPARCGGSVGVG
jgi:hypothetical protein